MKTNFMMYDIALTREQGTHVSTYVKVRCTFEMKYTTLMIFTNKSYYYCYRMKNINILFLLLKKENFYREEKSGALKITVPGALAPEGKLVLQDG